jgi:cell division transport system permease protein
MELVGAPLAYIRGPFVAEGFLQGGAGAVVALVALWVLFVAARAWWATDIAGLLAGAGLEFLPFRLCGFLVAGGMIVGSLGGLAGSRHAG